MEERQKKILEAIVKMFIETAEPIGSMAIYEKYKLKVSPATIRNDMAALEEQGMIFQPHTSAGRIPTSQAYRTIVNELTLGASLLLKAREDLLKVRQDYLLRKTKEKLFDTVSILASATNCISFATLPDRERVFYVGISNVLRQPEFASDPKRASQVIEILENQLYDLLKELEITEQGAFYIGEENLLPEFQSCSLIAQPYSYQGFNGVMGVLGATRMDYAYNMAALKSAVQLLNF
jgi:heat-inducible transcriptional repressor